MKQNTSNNEKLDAQGIANYFYEQGYSKALENEIDFLEGNDECNCCHKVNYWIRLRIKSLKQSLAKLKEKQ